MPGWDYGSAAAYFVTFKVLYRRQLLSRIELNRLILSPAGDVVLRTSRLLPAQFPGVTVDRLVIMPDHVHAILVLAPGEAIAPAYQPRGRSGREPPESFMAQPTPVLGKVVRFWKARSTRLIRERGLSSFRWQTRYWDRVIRNDGELRRIRRYLELNPARWWEMHHQECGG